MWTTSEFLNSLLVLVILLTWKEHWKPSYKRRTELLFSNCGLFSVFSATGKATAISYLSSFQTPFRASRPCCWRSDSKEIRSSTAVANSTIFPRFLYFSRLPTIWTPWTKLGTGYLFYLAWFRDGRRTMSQRREFSSSDSRTSEDVPTSTNCPCATPCAQVLEHMAAKERHKHITYKCINRIQRRREVDIASLE